MNMKTLITSLIVLLITAIPCFAECGWEETVSFGISEIDDYGTGYSDYVMSANSGGCGGWVLYSSDYGEYGSISGGAYFSVTFEWVHDDPECDCSSDEATLEISWEGTGSSYTSVSLWGADHGCTAGASASASGGDDQGECYVSISSWDSVEDFEWSNGSYDIDSITGGVFDIYSSRNGTGQAGAGASHIDGAYESTGTHIVNLSAGDNYVSVSWAVGVYAAAACDAEGAGDASGFASFSITPSWDFSY
jgi:hypothetical protein